MKHNPKAQNQLLKNGLKNFKIGSKRRKNGSFLQTSSKNKVKKSPIFVQKKNILG